ncbi:MAG: metal-sulfur cluster assembly factor [Actinomycetota bacterium]
MSDTAVTPTPEEIREALMVVVDPEIGMPIVELGLVYDVGIDDAGNVKITYTLTSMGCPVGPMIESQVRQIVESLTRVSNVSLEMTFSPPWTPEMMSEEAKAALGYF